MATIGDSPAPPASVRLTSDATCPAMTATPRDADHARTMTSCVEGISLRVEDPDCLHQRYANVSNSNALELLL